MYTSFYINLDRLVELKTFIRTNLPNTRFRTNPLKEGKLYHISLELTVEDHAKLNQLQNKWHDHDLKIIVEEKKQKEIIKLKKWYKVIWFNLFTIITFLSWYFISNAMGKAMPNANGQAGEYQIFSIFPTIIIALLIKLLFHDLLLKICINKIEKKYSSKKL